MSTEISSIAIQEDFLLWTELFLQDKTINIKRAVSDSLPISINYQTLPQSTTSRQVANQLGATRQKFELKSDLVRVNIPGRFSVIRKIMVDESIPEENYQAIAREEFKTTWEEPPENYDIYLPDYERSRDNLKEILAVAIRKDVRQFFDESFKMAGLTVESVSPSCFTVDNLFHTLYPRAEGQTLLLGWQRRGYDVTITDKNGFINYLFRPYNTNLDSIEQIEEDELLSSFDVLFEEVKHPPVLEQPIFDIKSVYCYGFHFKSSWLDLIKAQLPIPVHFLNIPEAGDYQILNETDESDVDSTFQFIEPISNII